MVLIRQAYEAIQKREDAGQSMTRKSLPAGDENRTIRTMRTKALSRKKGRASS
jgi:hypothetical protein